MFMLTQLNANGIIQACYDVPKEQMSKSYWFLSLVKEKLLKQSMMLRSLCCRWEDHTPFLNIFVEMEEVSAKLRNIELYLWRVPFIKSIEFREHFFLLIASIHGQYSIEDIVSFWSSLCSIIGLTITTFVFHKVLYLFPFSTPFIFV